MTKTTDVEIYGQRYTIRGEADEAYIRRLAGLVDGQMRQLAEGMNTTTPSRLPCSQRSIWPTSCSKRKRSAPRAKPMSNVG